MKFMNKNVNSKQNSLAGMLFYFFITAAVSLSLYLCIKASGIEIIQIYLNTSYSYYITVLCILSVTLIILFAYMTLHEAVTGTRPSRNPSPAWMRILSFITAGSLLVASGAYYRNIHLSLYGDEPTAPRRLWTRIGPVVQFGPFHDRRASYGGITVWYFDPIAKNEPAMIKYGREPIPDRMRQGLEVAGTDGKRHEFHLADLTPGTRYYYQIPDWGDRLYSFKTVPPAFGNEPIRFICIGDTGNTKKGGYYFSYYRDVMRAADKLYRDRHWEAAFIIHAGDAVRDGMDIDGWHQHFSSCDYSSIPNVTVAGNHEYLRDRGGNFRYFSGQPAYYSLDYAGAHILSIHPFDGPGTSLDGPVLTTGADQYRFVKEDLARAAGKKWIIVVIHIPVLATGDYSTNELLVAQYFDLFRKHSVDLVISGHNHNFEGFHADGNADGGGTIYIVAGSGGSALDSYIMDRKERRWKTWFHDPNSARGLYQKDRYTVRYFQYGELSWGFSDVEIRGDVMTVSYYRWLDFERFLKITGQDRSSWEMTPIDERSWKAHNLSNVVLVKKISKKKNKS